MSMHVIAGVTGHVGSVTANELLASGEKIKVIVRNPNQGAILRERGVEVAVGSLEDRAFLSKTLAGADGFFALLPPKIAVENYFGAQRRLADAIAAAVKQSSIPYVVMLSSLGADLAEGTGPIKGLHYLENSLRATGTKLAAIRASSFQENVADYLPAARQGGIFPNFLPSAETSIPMVASQDIGRLAAELLKSPPRANQIIDLLGPEYSPRQLSEKLGAALGQSLRIVNIPANGRVEALVQAGIPHAVAEELAEMYGAMTAGVIKPKGDRMVMGTTTIDVVLPGLLASATTGDTSRAA